ncbi:hypothetical protein TVAG_194710 [Trichomonas vaginalis G3]|uniref:Uncharacterized protein n=1 Tax=Trichomonas vaginalis (strain ATCC PRA-98 / G3) TaxID=412133 RepID=A2FL14_TRIV3|nr:hypothetical protein TVAG_194710 [Trichomonas vaginalis G3]|eukprot:XP_001307315.1 hypothetical protein [Trichomonas vaginalis G3]
MSSVQTHLTQIAEAIKAGQDTTKLEQTVSDMIFCFLEQPIFYKLPIELISRCIKNSGEIFTEKNLNFILANLSNALNKDATKLFDPIKTCTADQLSNALSKIEICPDLAQPLPIPESDFIATQPPSPIELLRRYNDAQLELARAQFTKSIQELRDSLKTSQEEIAKGPERINEAQAIGNKQIEEKKAQFKQEEDELLKKVQDLEKRYDDLLVKLSENPQQREFYDKYMSLQHQYMQERTELEQRLNKEVAPLKAQVDSYVQQLNQEKEAQKQKEVQEVRQAAANLRKQKKAKEQTKTEEQPKQQKQQKRKEETQEDMMEGLEEQEEDISVPLAIPEHPVPVKPINKPKPTPLPTKFTSIFDAILLHNIDEVKKFIEKKKSIVNERGNMRITPFTTAALEDDLEIMKILHENGADPNITDGTGRTAFHIAAAKESRKVIEFLADIKADISIKDKDGRKVTDIIREREESHNKMQEACKENDVRKLGDVLRKWPDMVSTVFRGGITPLHLAAGFDSQKICQKLLQWGADINAVDDNGNTPLHYAVQYDAPHTSRYLLRSAADATIKNKAGKLPLEMADAK